MSTINRQVMTLDEFTIQQLRDFPHATGELSGLLRDMGRAAKRVNVEVNKAGLVDILGDAGAVNVQGEDVKKLDIFANNQFMGVLQHGMSCAGIASEELDDFVSFEDAVSCNSKYICMFDPLDGSGNIDVNVSIGTIFSVYRRVSPIGTPVVAEDFLQPGRKQVAAGYMVYGSSTMLVYGTRRGVNGFTLDPSIGEFCLSHPNIKCPEFGKIYSVNHGNFFSTLLVYRSILTYANAKRRTMAVPIHNVILAVWWPMYTATSLKEASLCIPARRISPRVNCACCMSAILLPLLPKWRVAKLPMAYNGYLMCSPPNCTNAHPYLLAVKE